MAVDRDWTSNQRCAYCGRRRTADACCNGTAWLRADPRARLFCREPGCTNYGDPMSEPRVMCKQHRTGMRPPFVDQPVEERLLSAPDHKEASGLDTARAGQ